MKWYLGELAPKGVPSKEGKEMVEAIKKIIKDKTLMPVLMFLYKDKEWIEIHFINSLNIIFLWKKEDYHFQ